MYFGTKNYLKSIRNHTANTHILFRSLKDNLGFNSVLLLCYLNWFVYILINFIDFKFNNYVNF
jgi:hypothetical protein